MRVIQYSRGGGVRIEKPRRTGSPACAGDDGECGPLASQLFAGPTGKSLESLSSPSDENISLHPDGQICGITPRVSPNEGRLAIVTNARWDAVDADVLTTIGT